MKTIKEVFEEYKSALTIIYDRNEIEAITLLVINEVLALSKAAIKAFPDKKLNDTEEDRLSSILKELKTGKPVQYILGKTEFYGLTFHVGSSVLIPRPETEELVQWIISSVTEKDIFTQSLLDIGTGSGCIAISLKKHLPFLKVAALDISSKALKIAALNSELNQADIEIINADILKSDFKLKSSPVDIIVSNPPYVTLKDKAQMHINVNNYEPHSALFVPEENPLVFYKAIADFAAKNLSANGLLFFEINESYGSETKKVVQEAGFNNVELRQDLSGRDRMIKAIRN
ncbi:MAG TPA: peptide chain release factor N(5)-glutamine methyltransferase [Mucilaginibacter sp.]|nr:peptide chain release factor N(5)-glutamine methyltransferase [Mucilaginibacter sp.]